MLITTNLTLSNSSIWVLLCDGVSRHFPRLAQGWSEEEEYDRQEDYKQQPAEGKNRIRDAKLKELQRWVNDKERKEKPLRYIICMATRMNTENQRSIYNNWE